MRLAERGPRVFIPFDIFLSGILLRYIVPRVLAPGPMFLPG
jgi:hypothetical protein